MDSKNILVLDPAASTGYCIVRVYKTSADIYEYGIIDIDKTSDYGGDHYLDLMAKIQKIIDDHEIDDIAIEDYYFDRKKATGSTENVAYRTAIHIVARNNNLPYTVLSITAWKNFVAGRSKPSKEHKKIWGKDANKIYIQDSLWNRFGFRFSNHSISNKTGKPIKFRMDIVDVVGQAIYYLNIFKNIHQITLSVIPKDIDWMGKEVQLYNYD